MRDALTFPNVLQKAAADRRELLIKIRRDLHAIPEGGMAEEKTTRYILDFLSDRGILTFRPLATGAVAEIGEGEHRLLLRADIDGLPVAEDTGLACASRHAGWMHACGHDMHAAILLAVADALASGAVPFFGKVTLLFQPAEEGPGGCRPLLEGGLLERHPARRALALHVWPDLPVGRVGLSEGPVMAGMDLVQLRFIGRGGHGAYPGRCADPLLMAAQALLALRELIPGDERGVLTFGSLRAGTAPNVIPETAALEGTLRWLDAGVKTALRADIEATVAQAAARFGGRCEVNFRESYPPTVNHPDAVAELSVILAKTLGEGAVVEQERSMGSEDMSLILQRIPGCYLQLGAGRTPNGLHSPRFAPDEGCLETGLLAMLSAVRAFCGSTCC